MEAVSNSFFKYTWLPGLSEFGDALWRPCLSGNWRSTWMRTIAGAPGA